MMFRKPGILIAWATAQRGTEAHAEPLRGHLCGRHFSLRAARACEGSQVRSPVNDPGKKTCIAPAPLRTPTRASNLFVQKPAPVI